jgi:hypothetical protein
VSELQVIRGRPSVDSTTPRPATKATMSSADTTKVAASASNAPRVPSQPTTTAPSGYPTTGPTWYVVVSTPVPTSNRSPLRIAGSKAAVNGTASSCTVRSRASSTAIGVPGMAISATRPARARSVPIITCRRGNRSARPASSEPPIRSGRKVTAYVSAASRAEPVWSNTSRLSATRANWSPATDSTEASQMPRNARTANTSRNVADRPESATAPLLDHARTRAPVRRAGAGREACRPTRRYTLPHRQPIQ